MTWSTIDTGIPAPASMFGFSPFGTVRAIAIDQYSSVGGASQTLMVGGSGRFQSDGMGGFTKLAARIYKSIDAGANWAASDTGIGGAQAGVSGNTIFASVAQILQDPADIAGDTFYAATFLGGQGPSDVPTLDNGVFKSIDGGASWSLASTGLPRIGGNPAASHESVLSLAIDPTDPTGGTLYASTNDIGNSLVGTVYKTTDGGASWSFSGTGLSGRDVRDLVVDPLTGDVYAAVADPLSNGDGSDDASQADVASTGVAGPIRGTQTIVTAELTPVSGACSQIESSFGLDLLQSVPAERRYEMPFNGLHVRIPDCDQAELTVIYHGSVFDDVSFGMRGYGLDFPNEDIAAWHALPATNSGQSWTVTLTDGGIGDATPDDGVIVFQGGAKRLAERFFSDGMEAE